MNFARRHSRSIHILSFSALILIVAVLFRLITMLIGTDADSVSIEVDIIVMAIELVAAVMIVFQLNLDRENSEAQTRLDEAKFLLECNQTFIQDPRMTDVEKTLEDYISSTTAEERRIYAQKIADPQTQQQYINYLVYLEGVAQLILSDTLFIEHIDDLMAWRFFIAMNNPVIQDEQICPFWQFYRGCIKAYGKWIDYKTEFAKLNGYSLEDELPLPECRFDIRKSEVFERVCNERHLN